MFKAKHIGIGIKKDGTIRFLGQHRDVTKQCDVEQTALESGEYEHVIRINDDESIFELKRVTTFAYKYKEVGA